MTEHFAHAVEAVDISLGGSLGADAAFAHFVAGAVPVAGVPDVLARLIGRYACERRPGERFHEWARRMPVEEPGQEVRREPEGSAAQGGRDQS